MIKFSIIVPIYNVEKYLTNCLESIKNQSYSDFEVLMIDDGTKDKSVKIMEKYEKDSRFHSYHKENGGLSDARNYGVKKAKGEYLIFIDSDDEIEKDLLSELNKEIENTHSQVEVIKYQIKVLGKDESIEKAPIFSNIKGEEAFSKLISNNYFVTSWSYAYKRDFFISNKFMYTKGKYHEDFGLTPLIILKADSISSIDYVGYRYFIRENSIMTDPLKTQKKCEDTLYFFDYLLKEVKKIKVEETTKKIFQSYIANVLLCKCKTLKGKQRESFIKELKVRKIERYMIDDTLIRKLKKTLLKISLSAYVKFFVRM